jgi:hypothetical protein
MRSLLFLSVFFFFTYSATAQFDVSVVGSLPTGDFSDDKGRNDDGFAKFGFGAMAGYFIETGVEGLGIYPSVGFIINPSDRFDEIAKIREQQNQGFSFDSEGGNYLNIPITIGPSYRAAVGDGLKIYGTGHIGMNLCFVRDGEVSTTSNNVDYVEEYEINSPVSFAGGIEAGIILNDQFKMGVQFLSLGEPEFESDLTVNQTVNGQQQPEQSQSEDIEQPISMFLLKVGYQF